jgi:hypothetical protein
MHTLAAIVQTSARFGTRLATCLGKSATSRSQLDHLVITLGVFSMYLLFAPPAISLAAIMFISLRSHFATQSDL